MVGIGRTEKRLEITTPIKPLIFVFVTIALVFLLYLFTDTITYVDGKTQDYGGQCEYTVRDMISQYDWNENTAYAVMMAESRGNPNAFNPEWHNGCQGSVGLFQIACIHDDVEKLKNPEYNVKRAYELWKQHGWGIWGAYSNNSYEVYFAQK